VRLKLQFRRKNSKQLNIFFKKNRKPKRNCKLFKNEDSKFYLFIYFAGGR
jgi:monomeric isocitrate dehydrogenase